MTFARLMASSHITLTTSVHLMVQAMSMPRGHNQHAHNIGRAPGISVSRPEIARLDELQLQKEAVIAC